MTIKVSDGANAARFELNGSALAKSLSAQLPMTLELTDYAGNEKYGKPPEALSPDKGYETACPAGSLGYFAPWNNLCLFYGSAPAYPGQYLIGRLVEGSIEALSGSVTFELE